MTIQPGDCLGYGVEGWRSYFTHPFEQLVQTKTWSDLYHVEIFVGGGRAISADYRGVNYFPVNLERDRLFCVLRPKGLPAFLAGLEWFERSARGKAYDPLGLLRFYRVKAGGYGFICSELATQVYRASGMRLFNDVDARTVSPGMFLQEDAFYRAWTRGSKEWIAA